MRRRLIATVAVCLLGLVGFAAPAGAGDDPLEEICGEGPGPGDADGRIAFPTKSAVGGEIWNTTAEGQDLDAALQPGEAQRFLVFFENTDDGDRDIVVRADMDGEAPPPGFVVKVLRASNGKDVTDKVFGLSGLKFRDIEPATSTSNLIVRIKLRPDADTEAILASFVTGNYDVASACGDTVGAAAGNFH